MRRRVLIVSLAVLIAVVGGAFYVASLMLSESVYSSRGSLPYALTISRVIKSVPEVSAIGPSRFFASAGDGPKLPESAITYHSSADQPTIAKAVEEYLRSKGYVRQPTGEFVNGILIVSIDIRREADHNVVTVRENY